MKLFSKIFILLLLVCPRLSQARTTSYFELIQLQNKALIDRLELVQEKQKEILHSCTTRSQDEQLIEFQKKSLHFYQNESKQVDPEHFQKEYISDLINEIRFIQKIQTECHNTPVKIQSIRKTFPLAQYGNYNTSLFNRTWLKEIEPACFEIRQKGILKNIDGNACFAGDRVMMQELNRQKIDPIDASLRLSYSLLANLANTPIKGELDIKDSFHNEFNEENITKLLTLFSLISTSGPSGLTGWLQGFEDRLLINDLNSQKNPEQMYSDFKNFQLAKFNYIRFRDLADKYKVRLTLYGHRIDSWNRHNMMASFLGCVEKNKFGRITPELVYLTGIAYESKDFVSHIKEHVSLKAAEENFKTDTSRYSTSGELGYELCSQAKNKLQE